MAVHHPENKYYLKEVHQEIDYLDRKISYAQTLEKFPTEQAREDALKKLELKRSKLVKVAVDLANKSVEWEPQDLPRSFSKQTQAANTDEAPPTPPEAAL